MTDSKPYRPLYAEKRCVVCGRWRGEHICQGDAARDTDMQCPVDVSLTRYFQETPRFIPDAFTRGELDKKTGTAGRRPDLAYGAGWPPPGYDIHGMMARWPEMECLHEQEQRIPPIMQFGHEDPIRPAHRYCPECGRKLDILN